MAYLHWPLKLTTFCDFIESFTFTAPINPVDFTGATAEMQIRWSAQSPTPLVTLSTTPSSSGAIYLGTAPPGPLSGVTVANIAALEAFTPTGFVSGAIVFVTLGPAYYAWSPGGSQPVDGIKVVSGIGGQWLLTGTIVVNITKEAMPALQGVGEARYDVLVTFSDGTTNDYIEGPVYVDQSVTQE